jgi:hypothetical protein
VRSLAWSASAAKAVYCALESTADTSSSLADVIGAIPSIESVKEDPDAPFTADELRISLPEMPTNMQTENLVNDDVDLESAADVDDYEEGMPLSPSPFLANSTVSIAPVEDVQAGGVNDICAVDEIACGLTCGTPATVTYGRVVGPQVV